ncbi:MAG: caspase family protein [Rectinemataceae bacterium]
MISNGTWRIPLCILMAFLALGGLEAQNSENAGTSGKCAVIIGVNKYDQLAALQAGVNDAEKIAAYYSGIGFKVWLLDDRQDTRMNQPGLANLQRVMDNVRLQLWPAGHVLPATRGTGNPCLSRSGPSR